MHARYHPVTRLHTADAYADASLTQPHHWHAYALTGAPTLPPSCSLQAEALQKELDREADVQRRLEDIRKRMDKMSEVYRKEVRETAAGTNLNGCSHWHACAPPQNTAPARAVDLPLLPCATSPRFISPSGTRTAGGEGHQVPGEGGQGARGLHRRHPGSREGPPDQGGEWPNRRTGVSLPATVTA